jgi:hypothetical protein
MGRKREPVPESKRKRALSSCDRCKVKKRACHRFLNDEKKFDITIPCQNCVKSKLKCTTSIPRKKKKFTAVNEKSLKKIKYYTSIIKAMFPECDPTDLEQLKQIGNALFITLPDIDSLESFDLDNENDNGYISDDDNDDDEADTENILYEPSNALKPVKDSLESNSFQSDTLLPETQVGFGGADLLFNALLKIGHVNSKEKPISSNNNNPPNFSLLINGTDIHRSLLLNLIPAQECEMYTNVFFNKLHESYFIFDEKKFRDRQALFLQNSRNNKNLIIDNFKNEEICTMYLVWILGRNCYLTRLLQVDDPSQANIVPNVVIDEYWEMIKLCLSCCFFASNVHCIRMLYLVSLHCSTIKNRGAAWLKLTNACLKCYEMGYCRESTVSRLDESEQEEARIAWWSSFKLHMNNCAIMGRLPSISLYDVDVQLPKLDNIEDNLFKDIYKKSMELFKIMFDILKNREYLTKSRNPWCKENLKNVSKINNSLKVWKMGIGYGLECYKRHNPKRFQIKLHLQYYYCSLSLIAPYLIAFTVKSKKSLEFNENIISTLCSGVDSAIKLMNVISFSVNTNNFNGLLHYDLFYAYNSLMILLLAYTIIKVNDNEVKSKEHIDFKTVLMDTFAIDSATILSSIKEIREINNFYGPSSVGTMTDFSNNIHILLNYFNLNAPPIGMAVSTDVDRTLATRSSQDIVPVYNENLIQDNQDELYQMEKGFYDFINFISSDQNDLQQNFSDQLLLDWNKLFGTPEMKINGTCDHQF